LGRQECHVIRFSQSEMTSTIGVGCMGEVKTRKNQEVAWAEFLTFNKPVFISKVPELLIAQPNRRCREVLVKGKAQYG
jgi:hypothetical protein